MRWFHVQKTGRDCPSYLPGLYTVAELDQMIFVDGYIPVATPEEFADKIRTGDVEIMGAGTCWEGEYTTGANKKYVQVSAIDFTSFGSWDTSLTTASSFLYDGNELAIYNFTASVPIFSYLNYDASALNMRIFGSLTGTDVMGVIANYIRPNTNTKFKNNHFDGDINITTTTAINIGGLLGYNSSSAGMVFDFSDCKVMGTITVVGAASLVGGIIGNGNGYTSYQITNCHNHADIIAIDATYVSGIAGRLGGSIAGIERMMNCTNSGNIEGGQYAYGFCGTAYGGAQAEVEGCINYGNITSETDAAGISRSYIGAVKCVNYGNISSKTSGGVANYSNRLVDQCANFGDVYGSVAAGGIMGATSNNTISNSIAQCSVDGIGTNIGGIYGTRQYGTPIVENCIAIVTTSTVAKGVNGINIGTVTNTYWDITLNPTVSTRGTGKTTSELQTPTSNTGIYSAWTIPPWDFGTNSEYPKLTTTP